MKRLIILLLFFLGLGIFLYSKIYDIQQVKKVTSIISTDNTPKPVTSIHSQALFVPYWTMDGKEFPSTYNTVIYFGITANTSGIDTSEDGYKDMSKFISLVGHQKKLLTVRLLDQNTDEKILHDSSFQKKIITQSLAIAKQNGFDGILVDLEYKALAFDEVVHSVTGFSTNFAKEAHDKQLLFYQALYGDTFSLGRPFNGEEIGKVSDGVFILAYDFHKANGDPGPNFPLEDEEYNFKQMVKDFSSKVPEDKITIVFGMFGYDWKVNDKNQSVGQASTITTAEARQKFLPQCVLIGCIVARDKNAKEMHVSYTDASHQKHEVWYEDMASVGQKEAYVKSEGIGSIAFWAYSYF